MNNEIDRDAPLTAFEKVCGGLAMLAPLMGLLAVAALLGGCAYKGGKVVDGTNLEIGITVPGTEWSINVLSYTGGIRVCGNDATQITVSNEVTETNSYFGVVRTERKSKMKTEIVPTESGAEESDANAGTTAGGK